MLEEQCRVMLTIMILAFRVSPEVDDYFLETNFEEKLQILVDKKVLTVEQLDQAIDLIFSLSKGEVELEDAPGILEEAFGMEEQVARQVAADLVGFGLLPLGKMWPELEIILKKWERDPNNYPKYRLPLPGVECGEAVEEALLALQLELDERGRQRLMAAAVRWSKGEKEESELLEGLYRPVALGGLGFSRAIVDQIWNDLKLKANGAEFVIADSALELESIGSELVGNEPVGNKPVGNKPIENEPIENEPIVSETGVNELVENMDIIDGPDGVGSAGDGPDGVGSAVDGSVGGELKGMAMAHQELVAKVVNRTPPVINGSSEKAMLETDKANRARRMVGASDEAVRGERALKVAIGKAKLILDKTGLSEEEFKGYAVKLFRGVRDIYQTRDLIEERKKIGGGDLADLMIALKAGEGEYEAVLNDRRGTNAVDGQTGADQQVSGGQQVAIDRQNGDGRKDAVDRQNNSDNNGSERRIRSPQKARVELSEQSTAMAGEKAIQAVTAGRGLMGPVEQLKRLSIEDFRRISAVPDQAVEKILAMMKGLKNQSEGEYWRGAQAWRLSPLNQMYLEIASQALRDGMSLNEVCARLRAKGEKAASAGELAAIAKLNAEIQD